MPGGLSPVTGVYLFVANALDLLGDIRPVQLGVVDQLAGGAAT